MSPKPLWSISATIAKLRSGKLGLNLNKKLESWMESLGYTIGKNPWPFVIVPLFAVALLATGFKTMIYEKSFEIMMIPAGARCFAEKALVESYFPINYSDFLPDRVTDQGRYLSVLAYAADGGDVFRRDVFPEILDLHRAVTEDLRLVERDPEDDRVREYKWADLCARTWTGQCVGNEILHMADAVADIEDGEMTIAYPYTFHPNTMELIVVAGQAADPVPGQPMPGSRAVRLHYYLDSGSSSKRRRSLEWETMAMGFLNDYQSRSSKGSNISVFYLTDTSVEQQLDAWTWTTLPYLAGSAALVLLTAALCNASPNWAESKMLFGVAGAASSAMGCVAGMGFLYLVDVPFCVFVLATPFIILGIGMDDCFVLHAFWKKADPNLPAPERLAETYREAAVAITITSITNSLSFLIGVSSPIFAAQLFGLHTGVCVLAVYLLGITFLGGVLALYGNSEPLRGSGIEGNPVENELNRVSMSPSAAAPDTTTGSRRHPKKEVLAEPSRRDKLQLTAGVNPKQDFATNHRVTFTSACSGQTVRVDSGANSDFRRSDWHVFRPLAKLLTRVEIKIILCILLLVYWSAAIYSVIYMPEGGTLIGFVGDTHHFALYMEKFSRDFMDFTLRIPVVLVGTFDFSKPETQKMVENITRAIEGCHPSFGNDLYTDSWLRGFLGFLRENFDEDVHSSIGDEGNFTELLRENYLTPGNVYTTDVVFNTEGKIEASRFVFQAQNLTNIDDVRFLMASLRDLFDNDLKDYNLTSYHYFYELGEQFTHLRVSAVSSIGAAVVTMVAVSALLLPDWRCSVWIGLSVLSIVTGVMGFSTLFGVRLDAASSIVTIGCVGFSVDFSAHVSHGYLHSKAATAHGRVDDALGQVGLPVAQGALSTFVAVFLIDFIPGYFFRTAFTLVTLVLVLGAIHGLVVLPVMLSTFAPPRRDEGVPNTDPSLAPDHPTTAVVVACRGRGSVPSLKGTRLPVTQQRSKKRVISTVSGTRIRGKGAELDGVVISSYSKLGSQFDFHCYTGPSSDSAGVGLGPTRSTRQSSEKLPATMAHHQNVRELNRAHLGAVDQRASKIRLSADMCSIRL